MTEHKKHLFHETEEIELGKKDVAFVIRADGAFELYIPKPASEDDVLEAHAALLSAIAMRITDEAWCAELFDWMEDQIEKMKG